MNKNFKDGFIADRVYDYAVLTGEKEPDKPGYVNFKNSELALDVLHKHIHGTGNIAIHCDVDMDGVGSGYILYCFLRSQGAINRTGFMINRDKSHGITDKHVEYTLNNKVDLFIILDSSTNEIEKIKRMNCDVLVIDHHEVLCNEQYMKTAGGVCIVVNNMLDNENIEWFNNTVKCDCFESSENIDKYIANSNMSCGLVLYELLRLYEIAYKVEPVLEKMMLYQWVGVTLITDMISLNTPRNQWYIEKTVYNMDTELCLGILMEEINKWQVKLDKSFISFNLAPIINGAIRAGESHKALDVILHKPKDILLLKTYLDKQVEVLEGFKDDITEGSTYVLKSINNIGLLQNYTGVIATKLCKETNKNAIVFGNYGEASSGSFRGRINGVDYRKAFEICDGVEYAQGHATAFGFKARTKELERIMDSVAKIEGLVIRRNYITLGNMDEEDKGIYHIEDIKEFKRQGLLWRLSIANAKLSSNEIINIVVKNKGYIPCENKGRALIYDIEGLRCIAFEELYTRLIEIYVEYTNEIKIYARNRQF